MVVERRQRHATKEPPANPSKSDGVVFCALRFNPIHDLDHIESSGIGVEPSSQPQPQSAVRTALSKAKLKYKSTLRPVSKSVNTVNIRKPLSVTLADFLILSCNHNKASSSRLASKTIMTVNLDGSKHSIVVMDENSDHNVHMLARPLGDTNNSTLNAGDSSTRPLGEPPDNSIPTMVQLEDPENIDISRNNSSFGPT
ncbi:hypothetical protein V6N13_001244 [Hibiscus sabdariffa]|uniref:Uncharacterized protein n=1 Tax=Hibiscus sabdariffa TaxID=183260 RepID=A0ABR2G839_9ROSI